MKKNTVIKSLLVASLAVLSACGGEDNKVSKNCQDGNCATTAPKTSGDYMLQTVIPQLQQQYGSVMIPYSIPLMEGFAIKAGTYSWETLYKGYMLAMISKSGCRTTTTNTSGVKTTSSSAWATLNYTCFQAKLGAYSSAMDASYVMFANSRYEQYSFFEIVNWFISTGSSYSQMASTQYNYGTGYNQPSYSYDPYWNNTYNNYGYGGYQPNYYAGGEDQYYLNIRFGGQI